MRGNTVFNGTLTALALLSSAICIPSSWASNVWPTPISMYTLMGANNSFNFNLHNSSGRTVTIPSQANITLSGSNTIAAQSSASFLWVQNSASTTATIYRVG